MTALPADKKIEYLAEESQMRRESLKEPPLSELAVEQVDVLKIDSGSADLPSTLPRLDSMEPGVEHLDPLMDAWPFLVSVRDMELIDPVLAARRQLLLGREVPSLKDNGNSSKVL